MENATIKKIKLIDDLGGKCEICGFDRFSNCLEFHHKDPNEKSFRLTVREMNYSYEKLLPEVKKCMLLCSNCHRGLHNPSTSLDVDVANEIKSNKVKREKTIKLCSCGKEMSFYSSQCGDCKASKNHNITLKYKNDDIIKLFNEGNSKKKVSNILNIPYRYVKFVTKDL